MTDTRLTSKDPEPGVGAVVADDLGRTWVHTIAGYWVRTDDPEGDPESWVKIAGNYGPVSLAVEPPGTIEYFDLPREPGVYKIPPGAIVRGGGGGGSGGGAVAATGTGRRSPAGSNTTPPAVGTSADLASWLLEQIAEDERGPNFCHCGTIDSPDGFCLMKPGCPKRIAAECDAKRLILREHRRYDEWVRETMPSAAPPYADPSCVGCGLGSDEEPRTKHINECPTLRALALPLADRPGYLDVWRPDAPIGS